MGHYLSEAQCGEMTQTTRDVSTVGLQRGQDMKIARTGKFPIRGWAFQGGE